MKTKLKTILLIDDDKATNVYNSAIVRQAEVAENIEVRESGESALEYLLSTVDGKHPQPALIFLDVNMPGMNGWEFLEKYHELTDDQKGNIVVFMLTTSLDPKDKQKSKEMGAKGFIRKPLSSELVYAIVKDYFPENF